MYQNQNERQNKRLEEKICIIYTVTKIHITGMLDSQQERKQFNKTLSEAIKTENKKPIKMLKGIFYS